MAVCRNTYSAHSVAVPLHGRLPHPSIHPSMSLHHATIRSFPHTILDSLSLQRWPLAARRLFFILPPLLLAIHSDILAHALLPSHVTPFSFSSILPPSCMRSEPSAYIRSKTPLNSSAPICQHLFKSDVSDLSSSVPLSPTVARLIALLLTPAGVCTATVVGHRYLLTAAHCLRNFNATASRKVYRVLFSSIDSPVRFNVDGGRVENFRVHPKYRHFWANAESDRKGERGVLQYDVAWLRLATPRIAHSVTQSETDDRRRSPRNGFFRLNKRKFIPSSASAVRAVGFPTTGRYGTKCNVNVGDEYWDSSRYTARQTDLAVSYDPRDACGSMNPFNETTQICLGFGERGYLETGHAKQRRPAPSLLSSCYPWYVTFAYFISSLRTSCK